jgi:hypothetical protein
MHHSLRSRPHGILWEGRSLIDDAPIVAIVTSGTANQKTGPMATVWILRADLAPDEAKRGGLDVSICGHCAMRDACYVITWQAPKSVYLTYKTGRYKPVRVEAFERAAIRWGGYGDPALLPPELVRDCNARARMWTGYTHQHGAKWAQWARGIFMASCETKKQEERLRALGWGTFRAGLRDGSDQGSADLCAYDRTGETCIECGLCNGDARAIYVPGHGARAAQVPAERIVRRRR